MTRLDYEKQNRKELAGPVDADLQMLNDAAKHAKKRAQQKKHRQRKISRAIQAKGGGAFARGVASGKMQERERIVELLTAIGLDDAVRAIDELPPIKPIKW